MSAARINNKKQSTSSIKPFCKVCHDAGKTEKEYTSHFVRASPEPNAPVICPTLLAQPCRFCQQGGHTPAYCPELAKRKKAEEKAAKTKAFQQKKQQQEDSKPEAKPTKTANAFAAFDSDSEDEKPKKKQEQEQVFVIKKKQPATTTHQTIQLKSDEFPALSISKSEEQTEKSSAKQASAPKPSFLTALQQSHPSLKVPSKMTDDVFVNSAARSTIVINKKQMEQREQEAVAVAEEEEEQISVPSEIEASGFYDNALETFKKQMEGRPKASEMDWAQQEEDSDDEDW